MLRAATSAWQARAVPAPRSSAPVPSRSSTAVAVLVTAVGSVAAWWAWLGWDDEYQTDPVTGVASGPYEAWQVVGCVGTLLVLALVGGALWRPRLVALVMTVAFTAAWTAWAAAEDESGLFLVGAVLVLVGTAAGSALVTQLGHRGRRLLTRRSASAPL